MSVSKFKTSTVALQPAVVAACALAPDKSCIEAYTKVLFKFSAAESILKVGATSGNGDRVECLVPVGNAEGEDFSLLLHKAYIGPFFRTYDKKGQDMEFVCEDGKLTLATATGTFCLGKPQAEKPHTFPMEMPTDGELEGAPRLEIKSLVDALNRVSFASDVSGIRPQMEGVRMAFGDGKVTFTGASPKAMSQYEPVHGEVSGSAEVSIPMQCVKYLNKTADCAEPWTVYVTDSPRSLVFRHGAMTYRAAVNERQYPDCGRIFDKATPENETQHVTFSPLELRKAFNGCVAMAKEEDFDANFSVQEGNCVIGRESFSMAGGEFASRVTIPIKGASDDFRFALPSNVLNAFLRSAQGEMRLSLHPGGMALFQQAAEDGVPTPHRTLAMLVNTPE